MFKVTVGSSLGKFRNLFIFISQLKGFEWLQLFETWQSSSTNLRTIRTIWNIYAAAINKREYA